MRWRAGLLLWIACVAVPVRVSAADSSVVVLGLRSLEGDDDFANSMTDALRTAAKAVPGWRVLERAVSMSQMVLANNCDDVDTACLTNIARGLETERVIYGTVRRTAAPSKYNYEIALNLFNATTHTTTGPETETVQRNDGKKVLVRYAQLLMSHLSATEASVGRLVVDVNVLSATVRLDGQPVGETQERKLTLESVAPGEHTLEVSASGHETYKQTIYVHASEQSEVGVTLERTPEPTEVAATTAPPEAVLPTTQESEGHSSLNWLGYTLIGVGAASAIAWGASMYVIEFQYNRNTTYKRYKDSYQNRTDDACDAALKGENPGRLTAGELSDFQGRCRTGRTFQVLQWVFLGAAVVAAGSGIFVLLSDGGGSHGTETALRPLPRLALEPIIDRRSFSLQATLRF